MEIEYLYRDFHAQGYRGTELTKKIEEKLQCDRIVKKMYFIVGRRIRSGRYDRIR